jgi:hypothetical protein
LADESFHPSYPKGDLEKELTFKSPPAGVDLWVKTKGLKNFNDNAIYLI